MIDSVKFVYFSYCEVSVRSITQKYLSNACDANDFEKLLNILCCK